LAEDDEKRAVKTSVPAVLVVYSLGGMFHVLVPDRSTTTFAPHLNSSLQVEFV